MAGAIAELARKALASDFRNIDPRYARVVLIEAGPRLLATFPEDLSDIARRDLEQLGVEVRLGARVTGCDAEGVMMEAERLPARTVIWAAGVIASPAAKWLGCEKDRAGRVVVNADLSVRGHRDVYVIGDTAAVTDAKGRPVPGLAPAAKQMGKFVARAIRARAARRDFAETFRYRSIGNLATVGRKSAVVDFGWIKLSGFAAWALWSIAHVYFLIGFRNRLTVSLDWLWSYLSFGRGARLITDTTEQ
jgi:NADH dehydrogenase